MNAVLIDWGTTNLRAWLVDPEGRIVDRRAEPVGIRQVPGGEFAAALERAVGPWRACAPARSPSCSG